MEDEAEILLQKASAAFPPSVLGAAQRYVATQEWRPFLMLTQSETSLEVLAGQYRTYPPARKRTFWPPR